MTAVDPRRGAPVFPTGVDGRALLLPTRHSAWNLASASGVRYRRAITQNDPFLFAVTYLGPYLRDQTSGVMSFSPFHLDMASAARRWIAPKLARDGWVAPRGAAKTTWLFLVLPLWALAHGHRRFFLAFSYTAEQAVGQLSNLRMELDTNELLLDDFPELRPRRGVRGARNTSTTVVASGATIAARGLGSTTLGIRSGADRPDLIVGDDLEPDPADHTPEKAVKILSRLIDSILPMGSRSTVVQIAGTTTMAGSVIHDLVRDALGEATAPWIAAHGFRSHHYPPVLDDELGRRSMWPQRWTLGELDDMRERAPQTFALNMANRPDQAGEAGYWTPEMVRYDPRVPIARRVLYADVAMTNRKTSDLTALAVVGLSRDGRTAVVEFAEAGRWDGLELRERMWALTEQHPRTLREWVIEANQGGERWLEIVSPIPAGVGLWLDYVRGHKRDRLVDLLRDYQRRAIVHAHPLGLLERQQQAWSPLADRDDLLDAVAGGVRKVFGRSASKLMLGG